MTPPERKVIAKAADGDRSFFYQIVRGGPVGFGAGNVKKQMVVGGEGAVRKT